jgi:hypothetical protein
MDDTDQEKSATMLSSLEQARRPSEGHILFAPDPRTHRRSEDIAPLTLTRTFSRQSRFSSYSAASDEEAQRVRRVTSRRTVDAGARLPTSEHPCTVRSLIA